MKNLSVKYDADKTITMIDVSTKAPDPLKTVIALEYISPIQTARNAEGKYHW